MSISCRIVEDLMPIYVEGLTSEDSKEAIEEHLMSCPSCKNNYQALVKEIEVIIEEKPKANNLGYYKVMKKIRSTLIIVLAATFFIGILTGTIPFMLKKPKPFVKIPLPSNIMDFKGAKIIDEFTKALGNPSGTELLLDQNRIEVSFTQAGTLKGFDFQLLTKGKKDVYMYSAVSMDADINNLTITKAGKTKYEGSYNYFPLKDVIVALDKIAWNKILDLKLNPAYYNVSLAGKIDKGTVFDTNFSGNIKYYYISAEGVVTRIQNQENFKFSKDAYGFDVFPMFKDDSHTASSYGGEGIARYYVEVSPAKD
ncbi:MAG: zf-HC2 domain-containing protein [Clostridiaceae bacterium]|nr:zf-HC2 domain-containing protein [Clostridiaceae bacterium]